MPATLITSPAACPKNVKIVDMPGTRWTRRSGRSTRRRRTTADDESGASRAGSSMLHKMAARTLERSMKDRKPVGARKSCARLLGSTLRTASSSASVVFSQLAAAKPPPNSKRMTMKTGTKVLARLPLETQHPKNPQTCWGGEADEHPCQVVLQSSPLPSP